MIGQNIDISALRSDWIGQNVVMSLMSLLVGRLPHQQPLRDNTEITLAPRILPFFTDTKMC